MNQLHSFMLFKNSVVALILLMIVVGQSCREDNLSSKRVLLTVEIDPTYFDPRFDVWLFVSDKDGKTLDVRHAKDSARVRFLGNAGATVTFNIFMQAAFPASSGGTSWNSFSFQSFQQIPTGSDLQLKNLSSGLSPDPPDTLGSAYFILKDFDDSTDPISSVTFTDGIVNQFSVLDYPSAQYYGTLFSSRLFIRKNPSQILATAYRNNAPMYMWLNVKPGDHFVFSFNDFVPCKTIPINKQVYTGEVKTMTGANYANSYSFSNIYSWQISKTSDLTKPPVLGYLDGFDKYLTSVVKKRFDAPDNLYYDKAGAVPQSINLPDYTFTLNKTDLYGLSINFSNEYSYKEAYFIKSNSTMQVNWSIVASNSEGFKAPAVPSQILSAFPALNVDGLKMEYAGYTHCLDGYSYSDYVTARLTNNPRDVYEQLRYVVSGQ